MARRRKLDFETIIARQIVREQLKIPGPIKLELKDEVVYKIMTCLDENIKSGQTLASFLRQINSYLVWKDIIITRGRIEVLYKTYFSLFYGHIHCHSNIQSIKFLPYWQYQTIEGSCKKEICSFLDKKVIAANDPFWKIFYPPNHPGCSAYITTLNETLLRNRELKLFEPSNVIHPHKDWAFNPANVDWKSYFYKFASKTLRISRRVT